MSQTHILFVTGKLAEPALRRKLNDMADGAGFTYTIAVLPITVAALATVPWIARHLNISGDVDRVLLPGLCRGDLGVLAAQTNAVVERGPKDLRELHDFFQADAAAEDYGDYDIEILAEINHAPLLSRADLLRQSRAAQANGADVIDLGCTPGQTWTGAGDAVKALRDEGLRVSLDSFDPTELEAAAKAGAELILSVNSSNRQAAAGWGCEVVAVPDEPAELKGFDDTINFLDNAGVPFRIDPIIEPIGFGFAASLGRYIEARRRYPDLEFMMGIGNLTELTDVDSAGVNVTLLGFCQELGIRSVLTTEVINWCRSSIREIDLARRLAYHSVKNQVLPKHLEPNLVLLRDPKINTHGEETLRQLAETIKDHNFRIFAEGGMIHVMNNKMHLQGKDPFALIREMLAIDAIDAEHAFYLGYEMAKAATALTLGKNYVQDEALRWGFLTREEIGHHLKQRMEEKL